MPGIVKIVYLYLDHEAQLGDRFKQTGKETAIVYGLIVTVGKNIRPGVTERKYKHPTIDQSFDSTSFMPKFIWVKAFNQFYLCSPSSLKHFPLPKLINFRT